MSISTITSPDTLTPNQEGKIKQPRKATPAGNTHRAPPPAMEWASGSAEAGRLDRPKPPRRCGPALCERPPRKDDAGAEGFFLRTWGVGIPSQPFGGLGGGGSGDCFSGFRVIWGPGEGEPTPLFPKPGSHFSSFWKPNQSLPPGGSATLEFKAKVTTDGVGEKAI